MGVVIWLWIMVIFLLGCVLHTWGQDSGWGLNLYRVFKGIGWGTFVFLALKGISCSLAVPSVEERFKAKTSFIQKFKAFIPNCISLISSNPEYLISNSTADFENEREGRNHFQNWLIVLFFAIGAQFPYHED